MTQTTLNEVFTGGLIRIAPVLVALDGKVQYVFDFADEPIAQTPAATEAR